MHAKQAGVGLVEVLVTLTVLAVGVMAFIGSLASFSRASVEIRENDVCAVATRGLTSEIRKAGFAAIPAQFGSGTSKQNFWCDASGAVVFSAPSDPIASGEIEVFDDEDAVPPEFTGSLLGYDLNGDGVISSSAVTDYDILPVRVTMAIGRAGEERDVVLHYFLMDN